MWLNRLRNMALWLVMAVALGVGSPLVPWVASHLADRWESPHGDVLVVLGADILGDGTLGVGSYWRAVYGERMYRQHHFRKVIVCGGAEGSTRPVAAAMAEFMTALGVPAEALVLETRSRNTRENALYARELAGTGEVALVTSDYHMWRARRVFERAGMRVVALPFPDVAKRWSSWPQRWPCGWDVGAELGKIGYYWAQGWI